MAIEFIEFGKKGNSKEIKQILSHIFQRNNDLSKDNKRGTAILYSALTSIDACASMFTPFMPSTSQMVKNAIVRNTQNNWELNEIKKGAELKNIGHLFKKFD